MSRELALGPNIIKFWFQNKRTQMRVQKERAHTSVLQAENQRLKMENFALSRYNCIECRACPSCRKQERQPLLQQLHDENARLHEELHQMSIFLSKYAGIPASEFLSPLSSSPFPQKLSAESFPGQGIYGGPLDIDLILGNSNDPTFPFQHKEAQGNEKMLMIETAVSAMDEIIRLLKFNEPLWVKEPTRGRYVLLREIYEMIFPKTSHLKRSHTRFESSKDDGLVIMKGTQLVDMFLDSDKWVNLFPTMVTKATMIQALESGMPGSRHGCLKLMYEKMHTHSPLVAAREFYVLRYCEQTTAGTWVIVDVSYNFSEENLHPSSRFSWRLPSGCMIQDMSNGYSKVTWIEHVEVVDETITDPVYKDIVMNGSAYGAERWLLTLQRTCKRLAYSMINQGLRVLMPKGWRNIMTLANRMVKSLCECLEMERNFDFPRLPGLKNSGIQYSVRKSIGPGEPSGTIAAAATSLWLPLPLETVFNFFNDHRRRAEWDVLSSGNPVQEMANISYGTHPGSRISIFQSKVLMLQESFIDPLGALLVYAPIDPETLDITLNYIEDSFCIPVLPSGLMISTDCNHNGDPGALSSTTITRSSGSLLTVAFQILISPLSSLKQLDQHFITFMNALISKTVENITAALNCIGMD